MISLHYAIINVLGDNIFQPESKEKNTEVQNRKRMMIFKVYQYS